MQHYTLPLAFIHKNPRFYQFDNEFMFNLIKIGCCYLNNFASSFSIGSTFSCKRAKKKKIVATIFKIQGHFSEILATIWQK